MLLEHEPLVGVGAVARGSNQLRTVMDRRTGVQTRPSFGLKCPSCRVYTPELICRSIRFAWAGADPTCSGARLSLASTLCQAEAIQCDLQLRVRPRGDCGSGREELVVAFCFGMTIVHREGCARCMTPPAEVEAAGDLGLHE